MKTDKVTKMAQQIVDDAPFVVQSDEKLVKMAKFWLLREEIVERLENWANGMCQEYCVHSRDKEEDCFCNDPIFKKIEEIGE